MIVRLTNNFCINTDKLDWFSIETNNTGVIFKWHLDDLMDSVNIYEATGNEKITTCDIAANIRKKFFHGMENEIEYCDLTYTTKKRSGEE